jgi:two-component system sensor histidine kinase HydH
MTAFRLRLLWPVVLITLCLAALCAFTAVSLFRQQETITQVLRKHVASRRAVVELEECLTDLIALEKDRVETVSALHARVRIHLRALDRLADQPDERARYDRMVSGFAGYIERWESMPPPNHPNHESALQEATWQLEHAVLKPCQEFERVNAGRIEDSTEHHERVLRQLAWGMAGIGGLGGVTGVVFGFGVARWLTRSIRRLQVQVRDAAGKLGPNLPEIVLTREGDLGGLQEQVGRLAGQIEAVVQELQQREHEVLRAEQLAAVGQLAAGVAHEIRNPLTSIKMLVQAGLEDDGQPGLATDDLRVIEQEVRRMERSLQTFLDFARPPKPERRPVELCELVRSVAGLIRGRADKQRVAVSVNVPDAPITLTADRDQFQQVLVNLALNALDAMPTGGGLSLTTRRRADRWVEVEVADTGPGVAKDILPRLFQPFVSGKDTGLGLGLVISRRIIEDHGGTVLVANLPGGGARVVVTLPVEDHPSG